MTQYINDILNDFDAEFGIDSQFSQMNSFTQAEPTRFTPARTPVRSSPPAVQSPVPRRSFGDETLHTPRSPPPAPRPTSPIPNPTRSRASDTFQRADPKAVPKVNRISVEEASQIISDLRKERVRDAEKMQQLQTENARLQAKLTILEHTDVKVAELGSRLEQLLQKYLEAEQTRTQQAAQISELRQEVIVLKSRLSPPEALAPRRRT
jgi:hypothetical protein